MDRTTRGLLEKLQEWGADPVGFSLLFRGRFADWYSWEAYDWHSHVKDLRADVTAKMRIRRYGLLRGRDRVNQGRR
ncbi:MAG TPA: Ger(x)C family spore germination C-terminal domain-containing protein [Symbiobacteriaceae bacterium]|nr:Ger(x)C family spore germination C-terminal domain-containing protein [Symbiobacteriaceae bacterium]